MARISLYIGGKLADLGETDTGVVLFTWTQEDAASPAAVRNSYTKTVTLPGSPANNDIFNCFYRLDHLSASAAVFDPLARTPFVLYDPAGRVVERGYVKLDRVNRTGNLAVSYEVTLYGGFGSFIFERMYNADGTRKTLADIYWDEAEDAQHEEDPALINFSKLAQEVQTAWGILAAGTERSSIFGAVNFAPCNNGIPSRDFDASKGYYKPGATNASKLDGVPTTHTDAGVTYGPKNAAGGVLLDLGGARTEWEVQDLRASRQRLVMNVRRFLKNMELQSNQGTWRFVCDGAARFFDEDNCPEIASAWITLPDVETGSQSLASWLTGTMSPADYLLAIAKTFGLFFVTDAAQGIVYLTDRNEFYTFRAATVPTDLTDRVDASRGYEVRPYLMASRIYDFAHQVSGAFADRYREKYGRTYGGFRLDTSYGFDAAAVDVMGSVRMRGAADVLESSPWFGVVQGVNYNSNGVKFATYGTVEYTLYAADGSTVKLEAEARGRLQAYDGTYAVGPDFAARPQFHDAEDKPTDGDGALLYFTGMVTLPSGGQYFPVRWHLSDANSDMRDLTGGKECWNISPTEGVYLITEVPAFRRWLGTDASLDFGDPLVVAVPDTPPTGKALYHRYWQAYMAERFNRDTVALTAWVCVTGLDPGPGMLRGIYYLDGARWVVNRIEDYDPAGDGFARLQLIRVTDPAAYYAGQIY